MKHIRQGIYPTMITTFTADNQIDYAGLEALLHYYAACRCDGIFALCLSSEIFHLSDREMRQMMRFISEHRPQGMSLIASAHTSADVETGVRQLSDMLENGADEPVVILNRLAMADEPEDVVRQNAERLFQAMPDVTFGIYECPYPYKRLASDELLQWFAGTGRIGFLKDTCCDAQRIRRRLKITEGTGMQLFNANTATLLQSMRDGGCGFSGVMANFHADLYAALYRYHLNKDERADRLQAFLTLASLMETQLYPVCCKEHLKYLGIPATLTTRSKSAADWNDTLAAGVKALKAMEDEIRRVLPIEAC